MFFSLSPTADDRFPNRSSIPGGFFNHDNGWQWQQMSGQTVAFKGYTETAIDKLVQDPTPRHKGNFCLIIPGNQKTIVTHDINRSFPLFWYHDQQILTNLQLDNSHTAVYADRYVSLDSSLTYHQTFFNCYGNVDQLPITVEDCVDQLGCLLEQKIQNLKLDLPIKLFLSGGLDTGLLGALANKSKIDYERIHYEHFDYDQFTYKNITNIKKKYWAYSQIHHWNQPSVLLSGSCGDEFFLRGPATIALWLAWHNIDINNLTSLSPDAYHYHYFSKSDNKKIFQSSWEQRLDIQSQYTYNKLIQKLLDMLINDHQHWHLGETVTFTPFKDLEITKLLLRLPKEVLVQQMLHGYVSRKLIEKIDTNTIQWLNKYKNYNSLAIFS
jgi:hypothetical protein